MINHWDLIFLALALVGSVLVRALVLSWHSADQGQAASIIAGPNGNQPESYNEGDQI